MVILKAASSIAYRSFFTLPFPKTSNLGFDDDADLSDSLLIPFCSRLCHLLLIVIGKEIYQGLHLERAAGRKGGKTEKSATRLTSRER